MRDITVSLQLGVQSSREALEKCGDRGPDLEFVCAQGGALRGLWHAPSVRHGAVDLALSNLLKQVIGR
ncbi:hypothetical protein GCM10009803_13090 [Microbacterium ginsengiterrae]